MRKRDWTEYDVAVALLLLCLSLKLFHKSFFFDSCGFLYSCLSKKKLINS